MQKITSSATSLNQIPSLIKKIKWQERSSLVNLDMGGGKYDKATLYLLQKGVTNVVFDPYNRSLEENIFALEFIESIGGADTITCANVLNVIREKEAREELIRSSSLLIHPDGKVFFSIYEGKIDGIGKITGKDKWQNNNKTDFYLPEIKKFFHNVIKKGKFIIASEPKLKNRN